MPRRNYTKGRRRPTGQSTPTLGPRATPAEDNAVAHAPHCTGPSVQTFIGTLGDRMAHCRGCRTTQMLTPGGTAA